MWIFNLYLFCLCGGWHWMSGQIISRWGIWSKSCKHTQCHIQKHLFSNNGINANYYTYTESIFVTQIYMYIFGFFWLWVEAYSHLLIIHTESCEPFKFYTLHQASSFNCNQINISQKLSIVFTVYVSGSILNISEVWAITCQTQHLIQNIICDIYIW